MPVSEYPETPPKATKPLRVPDDDVIRAARRELVKHIETQPMQPIYRVHAAGYLLIADELRRLREALGS